MNVIVSIDFNEIGKEVDSRIKDGLNEVLEYLKQYAIKESPIDTGEYAQNHKISRAFNNGRTISGVLSNETPYAEILEYGVRGITYGYHRYGKLYMAGIGARVYTRTQDNNIGKIQEILSKHLSVK